MTEDPRPDAVVFIRDGKRFPWFASLTSPVEFLRPCTCVAGKVRRLLRPRYILMGEGGLGGIDLEEPDGHRFQLPPVRIARVSPANSRNLSVIESRHRPTRVLPRFYLGPCCSSPTVQAAERCPHRSETAAIDRNLSKVFFFVGYLLCSSTVS